mgnify:CR=1 FL=1
MSNEINPMAFFQEPSVADLRLLACPGAEELTELIDRHLVEWANCGLSSVPLSRRPSGLRKTSE